MKSRLLASALTAAALFLLGGAGTGHAVAPSVSEHRSHPSARQVHDVRHDVRRVQQRVDGDVIVRVPARRHGDITGLKVSHGERAVVARISLRSLTRADRLFGAVVQLRTSKVTYTAVVYRLKPHHPLEVTFDGGGRTSCADLRYRLNYRLDTVTITVPRECLGAPKWVRTRAVIDYFGPLGHTDVFYADAVPGRTLTRVPFLARVWLPGT
jgi:hypothetical protein